MNIEMNNEKIKKLEDKISKFKLKKYFFYKNEYLKTTCEIRIRNIMTKYYNGENLNENDIEIIRGYKFFSNPSIYQGNSEGPDFLTLKFIASYGSGNFEPDELEFINLIFNETKTTGQKMK